MHDLTGKNFNSNSPMKNYIKLNERIDGLQIKLRLLEQNILELQVK